MPLSRRHLAPLLAGLLALPAVSAAAEPLRALPDGLTECVPTRNASATPSIAGTHPRVLLRDARYRDCLRQLLAEGTPGASRFKTIVETQLARGNVYAFQPWFAALMYQLTGKAAYADHAVSRTEAFVAGEEALIAANQRAKVAGDSYLEVGQTIGNLALVYDWCHDRLTPEQRSRWIAYANQAVWNVWHPKEARWGSTGYPWTGWSIDNPSNNYYYSFLRATMLLGLATSGENPQAQTWIDQFRKVKLEGELFPTFTRDLAGGGSREGTGYGTAMKNLFELYDWWERSTNENVATRTPHTLASMAHTMHSIVPTLDRLAPTGDHARDSKAALFDYHRQYLQILMALFPEERLTGMAKSLLAASSVPRMQQGFMAYSDFLYENPGLVARPLADLATTYWGSGTGQLSMRAAWDPSSAYANFICGPYTESHAHRDQGSFVLFKGTWLAYDANMDSHSGIEQDESMHNLVRIEQGGSVVKQVEGAPRCNLLAMGDDARMTTPSPTSPPSTRASVRRRRWSGNSCSSSPTSSSSSTAWTPPAPTSAACGPSTSPRSRRSPATGSRSSAKGTGWTSIASRPAASPTWFPAPASTWPTPPARAPGSSTSSVSTARSPPSPAPTPPARPACRSGSPTAAPPPFDSRPPATGAPSTSAAPGMPLSSTAPFPPPSPRSPSSRGDPTSAQEARRLPASRSSPGVTAKSIDVQQSSSGG